MSQIDVKQILQQNKVSSLLHAENDLVSKMQAVHGERKTLVYENYSKLITASDTIRGMRNSVDGLEKNVELLRLQVQNITKLSQELHSLFATKKNHVSELKSATVILKRLVVLSTLPKRLSHSIATGTYLSAVKFYAMTKPTLEQYKHVPLFQKAAHDSLVAISNVRALILQRIKQASYAELVPHIQALISIGQDPDALDLFHSSTMKILKKQDFVTTALLFQQDMALFDPNYQINFGSIFDSWAEQNTLEQIEQVQSTGLVKEHIDRILINKLTMEIDNIVKKAALDCRSRLPAIVANEAEKLQQIVADFKLRFPNFQKLKTTVYEFFELILSPDESIEKNMDICSLCKFICLGEFQKYNLHDLASKSSKRIVTHIINTTATNFTERLKIHMDQDWFLYDSLKGPSNEIVKICLEIVELTSNTKLFNEKSHKRTESFNRRKRVSISDKHEFQEKQRFFIINDDVEPKDISNQVFKIFIKSFLELIRLQTFGKIGFQQIVVDLEYIKFKTREFLMIEECLTSASGRCTDKQFLTKDALNALVHASETIHDD